MTEAVREVRQQIKVIVVGDAPNSPVGLSRIARDLTQRLWDDRELLGIDVCQMGLNYDGSPWPWRVFPIHDTENWGREDLRRTLAWFAEAGKPTVVFSAWDPSRCYPMSELVSHPDPLVKLGRWVRFWGYFPIDAQGPNVYFGGPAAEALTKYARVLGYGRWGAKILRATLEKQGSLSPVSYLPHGLDLSFFSPVMGDEVKNFTPPEVLRLAEGRTVVGVVASNQPRKDYGLAFETLSLVREAVPDLLPWVHVDTQVKHWSIPQLAEDFGFNSTQGMVVTEYLEDMELAAMYSLCAATIAPGLGEGFGYPIVESLACGTPVVHGDYGGGAELVPNQEWLVPAAAARLDGIYGMVRPVFSAADFADRVVRAIEAKKTEPEVVREYCAGAVAHLNWDHLWLRWRSWFNAGLQEIRAAWDAEREFELEQQRKKDRESQLTRGKK